MAFNLCILPLKMERVQQGFKAKFIIIVVKECKRKHCNSSIAILMIK